MRQKRRFFVLVCFSVAGLVILHLLKNEDKHSKEHHHQTLHKREQLPHLSPAQEQIQSKDTGPLSFSERILDVWSRKVEAKRIKLKPNAASFKRNESMNAQSSYDCPYEGLGDTATATIHQSTCIPYNRSKDECNKAFEFYGHFDLNSKPVTCKHSPTEDPICVFKTKYRLNVDDKVSVECDPDICEDDDVLLGCRDAVYGVIPKEKSWLRFESVENLQNRLPNIIKENSLNGMNFCFIKCASDDNQQSLIFPPLLKRLQTSSGRDRISVNILVEDAVSRSHFYRSLPKTTDLLRKLKHSKNSTVQILDFELVQSYASFTVVNLRALFSGKKLLDKTLTVDRKTGIDEMAKHFQHRGYQTLVQEDLCFFDTWGTVLSEKYNKKLKPFSKSFKRAFQEYLSRTSYVDNRGLSHFACEVMRTYGYTNPFRHIPEVCSNGKFVSQYLLEYVGDFLRGVESEKNIAPALVYTHLDTAHESKGTRIRGDDTPLEKHIKVVSKLQNTITIIISDHGSKTTKYSINTFEGRLEVFSPLMFMIIPDNVAKILGKSRVQNLIANQKRLVSFIDLHGMLNSLLEIPSAPAVTDYRVSGLFAPVPLNRTCSDFEGLKSDVYCRCKGWNRFISTSSHEVHWLAEIALGHINNIITQQFTKGRRPKSDRSHIGYGACARFLGKSVETARQEISGNYVITILLLMVTPAYGVDSVERFEVKLNHSSVGQPNVQVMDIVRISVYGKYEACADKTVDVKLCACAKSQKTASARLRPDLRQLLLSHHFGLKTSLRFLSPRCLMFGERTLKTNVINKLQPRVIAFEIANQCRRTLKLKLGGTSRHSLASRKLPFTLILKPRAVVFLYAVNNEWKYGSFKPLVMLAKT